MSAKIGYIERALAFRFERQGGFARHFEGVGSPPDDLDIWFKNAQVYEELSCERAPRESERIALLTMIEAIRFDAMVPPPPGEPYEFDVSAYGFAEDVLAYRSRVIEVVLRQEAASPSFYEPLAPE